MLMPDSRASLAASSTRSEGQPSTSTTATLGAPLRFPLALEKKLLVTKEMARPAGRGTAVLEGAGLGGCGLGREQEAAPQAGSAGSRGS